MFNQKTRKKLFSFHKFLVELAIKSVNFLCRCAASTYPICFKGFLRLSSLLISFSPQYAVLKSLPHTVHNAKPFQNFLMNLNLLHHEWLNFTQYFLFYDGAGTELSAISFAVFWFFSWYRFYLVIIEKLSLNENKIWCHLEGMDMEQKIWKTMRLLKI